MVNSPRAQFNQTFQSPYNSNKSLIKFEKVLEFTTHKLKGKKIITSQDISEIEQHLSKAVTSIRGGTSLGMSRAGSNRRSTSRS